jgi:hypothetical protein
MIKNNYQPQIDLLETNQYFYQLVLENPQSTYLALYYNEFRIANSAKLPKTRPQILLGGPFNILYPNRHIYPLFLVADVVCLTCSKAPFPFLSTIHCRADTTFVEIQKKMPNGFNPDFYWDNQIEHRHFIPTGIDAAPFPIVASICHTYLHQSIEHVCELFDKILPLSKEYGCILSKKYGEKIIDLPFGVNWASFHERISPFWNKTIDVSVIFKPDSSPIFKGNRIKVIDLVKKFKEKYGNRFIINLMEELPYSDYIQQLQKSRITVNVTGVHGPYNYRSIEAICSGSMLLQYEWNDEIIKNSFSELFVDGKHGVAFILEDFESKLLYYLENPKKSEEIAREAYDFLIKNYSYQRLYKDLAASIEKSKPDLSKRRTTLPSGGLDLDMIYYYQNNETTFLIGRGIPDCSPPTTWIDFNNLMIYSGTILPQSWSEVLLNQFLENFPEIDEDKNSWKLCEYFYQISLSLVPKEYAWFVKWNFFCLTLEQVEVPQIEILSMINLLTSEEPTAFDERRLFFKYYANTTRCPKLQLGEKNPDFYTYNIDLMKNIDKPNVRAKIYHSYALKKARELLETPGT